MNNDRRWNRSDFQARMKQLDMAAEEILKELDLPPAARYEVLSVMHGGEKARLAHIAEAENIAIVSRLFEEAFNQGDLAIVDELFAPHAVDQEPLPDGRQLPGPEGVKQFIKLYRTAFPDLKVEVEEIIIPAEGGRVVTRESWRGTHEHEFWGIPANGQKLSMTRMHIFHIVNGKIVETWSAGSIRQQLCVVPEEIFV